MRAILARRPSGAVVVASGTANAATGAVSGDKLIKKGSLSGNRLKNKP